MKNMPTRRIAFLLLHYMTGVLGKKTFSTEDLANALMVSRRQAGEYIKTMMEHGCVIRMKRSVYVVHVPKTFGEFLKRRLHVNDMEGF